MAVTPLENYLRTHRKRAGLSQEEASQLVGLRNRLQFARYERYRSDPPLRVALACEQLFGVPTAQLFAGINRIVAKRTRKRALVLERRLAATSIAQTSRRLRYKMQWIADCLARVGRLVYAI